MLRNLDGGGGGDGVRGFGLKLTFAYGGRMRGGSWPSLHNRVHVI